MHFRMQLLLQYLLSVYAGYSCMSWLPVNSAHAPTSYGRHCQQTMTTMSAHVPHKVACLQG